MHTINSRCFIVSVGLYMPLSGIDLDNKNVLAVLIAEVEKTVVKTDHHKYYVDGSILKWILGSMCAELSMLLWLFHTFKTSSVLAIVS